MTQISLKLFNKMPFARNDIGGLSEGRVRAEVWLHAQVVLSQKVYVRGYFR